MNLGFSKEPLELFKDGKKITIKGNKRTKKEYILAVLKKCSSEPSEKSTKYFEQCLINTRLFSKVKISTKGENTYVEVTDRWTLIPIPYVKSQGDAKAFGFFLLDTNLFGYGKMITLGGTFGSGSQSYFVMYRDPSLLFSNWSGGVIIRNMKREAYNYKEDKQIEGFQERAISLGGYLGYNIYSKTNLSFSFAQNKKEFSQLESYLVPENNQFFLLGIRLSYKGSQFKFYFKEGLDGSLLFTVPVAQETQNAEASQLRLNLSYQKNNYSDHVIQLGLQHVQAFNPQFGNELKVGGSKGLRGLPLKGVWAERTSSLSVDYQVPFYYSKYGTWTFSTFADLGNAQTKQNQVSVSESFYSYGLGSTFFLKKVNFPGLGIFYGNNPKYLGNFFSFTLGRGL